jgi:hypothetical protein
MEFLRVVDRFLQVHVEPFSPISQINKTYELGLNESDADECRALLTLHKDFAQSFLATINATRLVYTTSDYSLQGDPARLVNASTHSETTLIQSQDGFQLKHNYSGSSDADAKQRIDSNAAEFMGVLLEDAFSRQDAKYAGIKSAWLRSPALKRIWIQSIEIQRREFGITVYLRTNFAFAMEIFIRTIDSILTP